MSTASSFDSIAGEYVSFEGEKHYRISSAHLMPPFFMSLVGADDHWMFVSSRGALTAGRRNSNHALFPYGTDDQISDNANVTGPATFIRVNNPDTWRDDNSVTIWEPFAQSSSGRNQQVRQQLYKSRLGTRVTFEETHETLQLTFRYQWCFSAKFGFVRRCHLKNESDAPVELDLLDGFRNLLPADVATEFQLRYSNLGDAYKRSEALANCPVSIHYLSSIPTDRAEPNEGLRATTVWQTGLETTQTLLSEEQLSAFSEGHELVGEDDVRGKRCAHLTRSEVRLEPGESADWIVVAEVDQDHSDIVELGDWLARTSDAEAEVLEDLAASEQQFLKILSASDAVQCGANGQRTARHLANTTFNVMRGGIPLSQYRICSKRFADHVAVFNRKIAQQNSDRLSALPEKCDLLQLRKWAEESNNQDLSRLAMEYLPLSFSRRHGDPTRPWNQFSIELKSETGEANLNYQGNWRDIFQNWEALALSFPDFLPSMVSRFLNATTADGYNPYRVTSSGIDWEEPEPDSPWANIGYWNDHQIIYLLKLLEWTRRFHPGHLDSLLDRPTFAHANVPYRIKPFEDIVKDPRNTIDFDDDAATVIRDRVAEVGSDGKLLTTANGDIQYSSLAEKLLLLTLTKLSNFVPDGGIWLNTQRPEWNDANNAIVGNGLSMVTVCYLHRWLDFFAEWLEQSNHRSLTVSSELAEFFVSVDSVIRSVSADGGRMTSSARADFLTAIGRAGCAYRRRIYAAGFSAQTSNLLRDDLKAFVAAATELLSATIRNNRRDDGLFHSYNLIAWRDGGVEVEHLYEMLEGQVAVLSSGVLAPTEADALLTALRRSALYRENQNSYLLYPDRKLPRFMERNEIDADFAASNELVQQLLTNGDQTIVVRDALGTLRFHASFHNAPLLRSAIAALSSDYDAAVQNSGEALVEQFEEIFGHRQFTGRSGTFFAYEGLGSIYWHMVSKLRLAVSENYFSARESGAEGSVLSSLQSHLQEITAGIGAEKAPHEYGAFPSDPYSHTPENAGVKQPGMTGQVKEDILSRFAELGIHVEDGRLHFRPTLFDADELLDESSSMTFFGIDESSQTVTVPENSFGFTLCQTPVVYAAGERDEIQVHMSDGSSRSFDSMSLDEATSRQLFARTGEISKIDCRFSSLRRSQS